MMQPNLTDAQWAAIAPLVTVTSPKGGRLTEIDLRAIVNALLSKHRTGCQWRPLPVDFPHSLAYGAFFGATSSYSSSQIR
ncbi:transposase [Roseiflexus sp.]